MNLKALVGSGERIGILTGPVLVVGLIANILWPSLFSVGGPPDFLKALSIIMLIPGVAIWLWSVVLILTRVPRHELITYGPYALVKHPLYTAVALLVLPWVGFLLDTWLGVVVGIVLYISSRMFAPEEDNTLAKAFGAAYDQYSRSVMLPWL